MGGLCFKPRWDLDVAISPAVQTMFPERAPENLEITPRQFGLGTELIIFVYSRGK